MRSRPPPVYSLSSRTHARRLKACLKNRANASFEPALLPPARRKRRSWPARRTRRPAGRTRCRPPRGAARCTAAAALQRLETPQRTGAGGHGSRSEGSGHGALLPATPQRGRRRLCTQHHRMPFVLPTCWIAHTVDGVARQSHKRVRGLRTDKMASLSVTSRQRPRGVAPLRDPAFPQENEPPQHNPTALPALTSQSRMKAAMRATHAGHSGSRSPGENSTGCMHVGGAAPMAEARRGHKMMT
jgi:hypothetical protein